MRFLLPFLLLCVTATAQKRVLSHSFEFEKTLLSKAEFEAHFLGQPTDTTFALVLKDNRKVEYLLLNRKFKTLARLQSALASTVFNESVADYAGGSINGQTFHFVYSGKHHFVESVDFAAKTVTHKLLFEDTREEKPLASFTQSNQFYSLTSSNKTNELVVYRMGPDGQLSREAVKFPIPAEANRKNNEVSEYLHGLKVILTDEHPDLSNAVHEARLFAYPDKLQLLVNNVGALTHLVELSLPDLALTQKQFDYADVIPATDKKKWYTSSFIKSNRLFSLLLNKTEIRVVLHDLQSGQLLKQFRFTDDAGMELLAQPPVSETRLGKKTSEKELDIKKLIRELTRGTYDLIKSGGGGGSWDRDWRLTSTPGTSVTGYTWTSVMSYRPGAPSYTRPDARYYTTAYSRMLLDPGTLNVARGRIPTPETDQIKDYIETIGTKVRATNQFSIGTDQYFGYYDREAKAYLIDLIRIVQ
jgi:hypothetical protein